MKTYLETFPHVPFGSPVGRGGPGAPPAVGRHHQGVAGEGGQGEQEQEHGEDTAHSQWRLEDRGSRIYNYFNNFVALNWC